MDKEKKSLEVEKQKEQENLFKLSLFEQQLRQMHEQIEAVESGIKELNLLSEGLKELVKSGGKEIYAPIGRGIFIKSKILSEELLVDVGNKNLVKKDIPKTQELIKIQIEKLEEIKKEIDANLDSVSKEVERLIHGIN
ncbi:hypothetical protein J4407_00315 [Candidatus Pacearchaeota archaeon]|nr:hypothetical protein [Candidatus Pacearchaeota archaeon]